MIINTTTTLYNPCFFVGIRILREIPPPEFHGMGLGPVGFYGVRSETGQPMAQLGYFFFRNKSPTLFFVGIFLFCDLSRTMCFSPKMPEVLDFQRIWTSWGLYIASTYPFGWFLDKSFSEPTSQVSEPTCQVSLDFGSHSYSKKKLSLFRLWRCFLAKKTLSGGLQVVGIGWRLQLTTKLADFRGFIWSYVWSSQLEVGTPKNGPRCNSKQVRFLWLEFTWIVLSWWL